MCRRRFPVVTSSALFPRLGCGAKKIKKILNRAADKAPSLWVRQREGVDLGRRRHTGRPNGAEVVHGAYRTCRRRAYHRYPRGQWGGRGGRLSALVHFHVHVEVRALPKALVAKLTLQRPLLEMNGLSMNLEWSLATEALGAHVALVRLLLKVHRRHVDLHVVLTAETLSTVLACEWPFLEMDGCRMTVEGTLLSKLEIALGARKGTCLVMCAGDVAVVAGDATEALSAQAAFDALLRRLRPTGRRQWRWLNGLRRCMVRRLIVGMMQRLDRRIREVLVRLRMAGLMRWGVDGWE